MKSSENTNANQEEMIIIVCIDTVLRMIINSKIGEDGYFGL